MTDNCPQQNDIPIASERCLTEMSRQQISVDERTWMIEALIATQALSGIDVPADVAATAFEEALFLPMPDIG